MATAILWWLAISRSWGFALGWVALVPLLWVAREMSPWRAFTFGWAGGVAGFWLVNWWIIPTIAHAAPSIGLPVVLGAPLGAIAVLIIALVHGAQMAVSLGLAQRARAWRGPWAMAIVFAISWGVCEWARTLGSGAHSWGALAFSQWRDLPMLQNVRWMGQHGLSAFCAFVSAALALGIEAWMLQKAQRQISAPGSSDASTCTPLWHRAGVLCGVPVALLALLHVAGAWRLAAHPEGGKAGSEKLNVLLVQTNMPSTRKGTETAVSAALRLSNTFFNLHPGKPKPDLVVWPETTLSGSILKPMGGIPAGAGGATAEETDDAEKVAGAEAEQVRDWVASRGVPILVGSSLHDTGSDGRRAVRNDAVWFGTDGKVERRGKTRPVPFGERALFSEMFPFLEKFAPDPMVEPAPTRGPMKVQAKGRSMDIGSVICFESAFSHPAIEASRGASALMVLTNDEWFGQTEAPFQHAAMGVLRAVECGVPLAQAANGGRSFAVDRFGRALKAQSSLAPVRAADGMADVHIEEVLEVSLPLED